MSGTTTDLQLNSLVSFPYTQRLSWRKKKAHDFQWAEEMADYYDYYYGTNRFSEREDKYRLNYDLYNGRGDQPMSLYAQSLSNARLAELGIDTGYDHIQHHDIISQIAKAMVGEQKQRPLRAVAVDTSHYAMNIRKYERQRLLGEYLRETVLQPIENQVTQQYLMENQIPDPYSLSREQQQQMQADIQQRTKAMAPNEIFDYMRKDYKTPSEKQAQQLLDYLVRELNIKWKMDEGFKHAIITGMEVYRVSIRHNQVYLDMVNPVGFTYSAKANTFFIEEADWAKYEERVKFSDLFNEYGDQMREKHFKKIDRLFHGMDATYLREERDSELVRIMERLPEGTVEQINPRTKEGQEWIKEMLSGNYRHAQADIRKAHIVWKSLRKLKYITRIEKDAKVSFFVDESYRFNELKGDIEEKIFWVPEVWETTKFGTVDALYFDKRPVPYQYKSLHNPWDVKLPYYGAEYSRLMGNSENVSPIDLGKPWQFKFNVQMARLQEMEQTDLGKILLTTTGAIPQDWSPGDFFAAMKYGKMAQLDLSQEGVSAYDAQFFKSVDLSNLDKISGQIGFLQFLQQQVATAMSYNASRLGQISPYIPVTNNQQNIVQSSFQTEDIYSMHAMIQQNVLNGLIDASRVAYKHNPIKAAYVMDDMSLAELELDHELLARSEIGVFISTDSLDYIKLEQVRDQAQAMIQNGLISFPELIRLTYATSGSELLNLAEEAQRRFEEKQAETARQSQEQQQQMLQAQRQTQIELMQLQEFLRRETNREQFGHKERLAEINASMQERAYDIDRDRKSDLIQAREIVEKSKQFQQERELAFKREELAMKERLEREKIKAQKDLKSRLAKPGAGR